VVAAALIALGAVICATAVSARAQATPTPAPIAAGPTTVVVTGSGTKPSESPLPSCLDETIRDELGREMKPRGVQERDFLKKHKLELVGHGGLYSGDLISSSYIYGGSAAFFFTEDFGIEGRFDVTHISLAMDGPIEQFFGDVPHFNAGKAYLALGNFIWSPIHAKMKMGGGIVHADILLTAGAGRLMHDSVQGVTYDAGMSLDLFTTHWITFRFDARDVMAVQEAIAETRFTHNLMATAGLAIWIPL
jgi:outer membrane beta-barrel protein